MQYWIASGAMPMIFCAISSARGISSVSRNDFIHQPDAVRFLRGNHFAGKKNLHGESRADQPRQPLRAAVAGNESELHFGLAELCVLAGQAHGAGHGDLASAAQREAVDAGDHRLAQVLDQIERGLAFVRVSLGFDGDRSSPAR